MTPEYVIQRAIRVAKEAKGYVEEICYYNHYCEPGYSTMKGVFTGNWNTQGEDKTMERLGDILERMGYELEWSDEWDMCEDCEGIFRIHPDSHWWEPNYVETEDGVRCLGCQESYLEESDV